MSPRGDRVRRISDKVLADRQEGSGPGPDVLKRFAGEYLRPHVPRFVLLFFIMLAWGLTPFAFAMTHRFLIDDLLGGAGGLDKLLETTTRDALIVGFWWLFGLNIGIHTVSFFCQWSQAYLSLGVGRQIAYSLREKLYSKLDRLHIGYHERTQTGRIMSRVQDDVETVQGAIDQQLNFAMIEPVKLVIGLGFLFYWQWRLTLFVVVALPIYAVAFAVFRPLIRRCGRARSRINSRLYGLAEERIGAIRVVQAFGREEREMAVFSRMAHEGVRVTLRQPWYHQGLSFSAAVVTSVVTALVLYFGLSGVRDGTITLGTALAYVTALYPVFMSIGQIVGIAPMLQISRVSLRRIYALLDQAEDVLPGRIQLSGMAGKIDFDGVTFTYPNQTAAALEDVSFRVDPGQRVALMGPSGSGKTTVLELLLRVYDPQDGAVRVGGVNLREADPRSVRRHVRLVQQEPFIFSGTIRQNITYGTPGADPVQAVHAANAAELHEFVMDLPLGYETQVGENGMSLSGGQKQRLSLATALLTDPEVLLLDDVASALDARTEARIRATLNKVMEGRTSIVVTHRIATARDCDRIIVLEQGRIIQTGTHEQLAAAPGFYRRICEQQESL